MRDHRIRRDREAKPLLLAGLQRLEYRGYDSAGIALREDGGLEYVRAVGNLQNLVAAAGPNGSSSHHGLGHTRWATHGGVTERTRIRSPAATGEDRDRPQRDRRELPRAEGGAQSRRATRSRRRPTPKWSCTSLEREYDGDLAAAVARASTRSSRGTSRSSPSTTTQPRPARRRAPPDAARRRRRRGRDVPRLERRRVPQRDAPRPVPRRRRGRRDHAGGRALLRRRRRGRRTTSSRSTGTTRAPRRAATRRSC